MTNSSYTFANSAWSNHLTRWIEYSSVRIRCKIVFHRGFLVKIQFFIAWYQKYIQNFNNSVHKPIFFRSIRFLQEVVVYWYIFFIRIQKIRFYTTSNDWNCGFSSCFFFSNSVKIACFLSSNSSIVWKSIRILKGKKYKTKKIRKKLTKRSKNHN